MEMKTMNAQNTSCKKTIQKCRMMQKLREYDFAIIPSVMLRSDDEQVFLDDISVSELSEKLNVKIISTPPSGNELLYRITGKAGESNE